MLPYAYSQVPSLTAQSCGVRHCSVRVEPRDHKEYTRKHGVLYLMNEAVGAVSILLAWFAKRSSYLEGLQYYGRDVQIV